MGGDPLGDDGGDGAARPVTGRKARLPRSGCAADLVAVAGDPLADVKTLRDVKAVVAAWKVVKTPR